MLPTLTLAKAHVEQITDHARAEAPNECCGILAGNRATVSTVYQTANVDKSPVKYTIDPKDMQRIFREVEAAGTDVLAFYHSHTATEAYPSVTDIKFMPPPGLFDYHYLIISLADAERPVLRAFRHMGEGAVEEIELSFIE